MGCLRYSERTRCTMTLWRPLEICRYIDFKIITLEPSCHASFSQLFFVLFATISTVSYGADFENGLAAWNKDDYATAF